MKTFLSLFLALASLAFLSRCGDDDDDGNGNPDDWAGAVAGTYTGSSIYVGGDTTAASIVLARVSDKMLNMQILEAGVIVKCLDSVTMNTTTTLVVDETDACYISGTAVAGSGNFSGGALNCSLTYTGGLTDQFVITGSK